MGENKYARMAEIAQQLHGTEPEPEIQQAWETTREAE